MLRRTFAQPINRDHRWNGTLRENGSRSALGPRDGLTLLEVIVSLAIFLLSIVAIGRLISLGSERALDASQRLEALQLAQSKLAEASVGAVDLTSETEGTFEHVTDSQGNPVWTWKLETAAASVSNLYNVTVRVSRTRANGDVVEVSLSQLIFDPYYRGTTVPSAAAAADAAAASSSTSGTTTSGSSQ
jgi:prepilin-type N-terminal cleavage/methylation domain-containing protein